MLFQVCNTNGCFIEPWLSSEDEFVHIPVIDTHILLYDTRAPGGIPWPPENDKVLYKPTLPENFKP